MDLGLKGKVAIVTGGNRGIGKAVAKQLAREGCDIAIAARDMSVAEAVCTEIANETGRHVKSFKVDTGDDAAVKAMVAAVVAEFGRIDILVNNAAQPGGQSKPPALAEITDAAFFSDMNVKVMGYIRCAREAVPHIKKQPGGRIINISGLAARNTGNIIGSVRNIGVAAMSKNLADELAPFGITVNCVHPKLTRTEKLGEVIERNAVAQGISAVELEKRMAASGLLGRLVTSEEVADVVAFLASPRAVSINGDTITVGGGAKGTIHY